MANFNDPKKKNTSLASFNQIIGEIFQKYNLEETGEQILEKIAKGDLLNANIVLSIARKINSKEVPENQATSLLEAQLKIPRATAEKLSKDIKEKVIPLIGDLPTAPAEEAEENITAETTIHLKPPIGLKENEEEIIEPAPKAPLRTTTFPKKSETTKETKRASRKSDAYREPTD